MLKGIWAASVVSLALTGAAAAAETCALPSVADTVELKALPGSALMTVPVAVNGKPRQFLLDLSTNPSEVSQASVTELGLPEYARQTEAIQLPDNGKDMGRAFATLRAPVYNIKGSQDRNSVRTRVRVAAFTIGRATGPNMQFLVANDPEMGKSEPYDGLLTNDFFKQYDVEVDFAGKQINYLTPIKCTDPEKVVFWSHEAIAVIPITLQDGRIQVPVTVEGHLAQAVIDTTSARTVMRRDFAELTLGFKPDTPSMMPAGGVKDAMGQDVYVHTFSQISFAGGVTAVNVPALIQASGTHQDADRDLVLGSKAGSTDARIPDLTLGMDVLHQLHLYVVFGQKNLYATAAQ